MPNDYNDPVEAMIRRQGASGARGKRKLQGGYASVARGVINTLKAPFGFPNPPKGKPKFDQKYIDEAEEMGGTVDFSKYFEDGRK